MVLFSPAHPRRAGTRLSPRLRSQSCEHIDVPLTYASSFTFPAALLDDHFVHPENCIPIVSPGSLGAAAPLDHP